LLGITAAVFENYSRKFSRMHIISHSARENRPLFASPPWWDSKGFHHVARAGPEPESAMKKTASLPASFFLL
jgi:hypothetical protein